MPTDCFVDKNGGIFKRASLQIAAESLPIVKYKIDAEKIRGEVIAWKLKNFHDFLVHHERVANADLDEPLILRSDGFVMDGWHRIIKAILLGIAELPAKQFVKDPEPDYFLQRGSKMKTRLIVGDEGLATLVNEHRLFHPPVAVIEGIVLRASELSTILCDCGDLAVNQLFYPLREKVKHCCERSSCIMTGIKMLKL